jgi:acetylornithine deacetylase/succinyl-diaminopimelate desuccinylase-like protein
MRSVSNEETLREVCEHLAAIDTTPCSPGEREAAEWIAERLRAAGVTDVVLEDEPSWGSFAPTATGLGVIGVLGAAAALARRPKTGVLLGLASILGVLDEAENGPRVVRRVFRRRQTTVNVTGRLGDPNAPRTLVILAHHDAAQTGKVFDQTLQRTINERFPGLLQRFKSQPPQWWIAAAAPLGALITAITGRRRPAMLGVALGSLGTYLAADIWRSPTVPGANDNLSAVAVIVSLAERLRDEPIDNLRIWLVSAGAEETLQDGIRGFMARHGSELLDANAWFLVPDTVGSPDLIMVEGEGPFWMHEYSNPAFRDLVERCATELGIPLERGFHARASTDAVIPSRAGFPTVMLGSLNEWRAMSNYHQMTDVPENLDYGTIADVARLAYAVAETLASQ